MKKSAIKSASVVIIGLAAIIITAFTGSVDTGTQEIDLLRNEQQREQAFNQILNDNQLFSEFMNRMNDHPDGMKMMRENMMQMIEEHPSMIEEMMGNMMQMMEEHPSMREKMMENMMQMMDEHPSMKEKMMEKMREHDHMHHHNDHN